ncbi:MAG: ribosome-associated translation inhibitor RaiA [Anaerolineae bacterium]|nr:ribosome-associated translation inhibitor RaiA [Anaerolineae bacterium]
MQVQLVARNLEITPRLQEYVEQKIEKLERYISNIEEARMELVVENTRSNAHRQVAQLTIWIHGTMLRAEERGADMFTAIDATLDKMRRQISRYKNRQQDRRQRGMEENMPAEDTLPPVEIVRVKRFEVLPMSAQEAIEQMELLGHQFFVFLDGEQGGINVAYRRRDGGYGLIVPEIA